MELNIENCSSNFVLGGVYVRGMVIPSQGTFLDKRKQCYDFKILLHYIITMSLELVNHWAFLFTIPESIVKIATYYKKTIRETNGTRKS